MQSPKKIGAIGVAGVIWGEYIYIYMYIAQYAFRVVLRGILGVFHHRAPTELI